jgi:hypothetical protein
MAKLFTYISYKAPGTILGLRHWTQKFSWYGVKVAKRRQQRKQDHRVKDGWV